MQNKLAEYIADAYSIVTPTQRLSRYLTYSYNQQQIKSELQVWQSADIITWDTWLKRLWTEIQFQQPQALFLLNNIQQTQLWKDVIENSAFANRIMQVNATIKQVMQSYERCYEWQIPIFPEEEYLSEDSFAFKRWVEGYEQKLNQHQQIDMVNLPNKLIEHFQKVVSDKKILLYGFDDFTARQTTLVKTLIKAGAEVIEPEFESRNKITFSYKASDKTHEIRSCANWIKQQLLENKEKTIGVVVPNLHDSKHEIEFEFNKILQPETLTTQTSFDAVYNISLGETLYDYPIIHHALLFLGLNNHAIEFSDISQLLHSPFFKWSNITNNENVLLEKVLRDYTGQSFSIKYLRGLSEVLCEEKKTCSTWIDILKEYEIFCLSHAKKQNHKEWAIYFSDLLKLGSWPGERSVNSAEQQAIDALHKLFDEFSSLDKVLPKCHFASALSSLRYLVQQKRFQPETQEVPVQIVGLSSAAAMEFDYVWIMSSDETQWPQTMQVDGFIPISLQRQYKITSACIEKQYEFSQQLLQNLQRNSEEIIFSYAVNEADQEYRLSSLVNELVTQEHELNLEKSYENILHESSKLEEFIDVNVDAVPNGVLVSGGASLFKSQSACPFQAFAKYRLNAESLNDKQIGLDAAERGELLHNVLQYVWQRIRNSEKLNAMSEAETNTLLESVVSEVLTQFSKRKHQQKVEAFLELEKQRLHQLALTWLELEKQRPSFRVVMTEEWQIIIFNDFELRFRLDRVDELENGQRILIDYKTGQCSPNQWYGERPEEPQLPLYAITLPEPVAGLLFAKIKTGEMLLTGLVDSEEVFPDDKVFRSIKVPDTDWQETLEEWRENLYVLAEEYKSGYVAVEPRDDKACQYCDLHGFCRIGERITLLEQNES